jgi:hypothetical protein
VTQILDWLTSESLSAIMLKSSCHKQVRAAKGYSTTTRSYIFVECGFRPQINAKEGVEGMSKVCMIQGDVLGRKCSDWTIHRQKIVGQVTQQKKSLKFKIEDRFRSKFWLDTYN